MRRKAEVSWRDVDKRMRRVVKLRQEGLSLREIGHRLAIGKSTVERDLRRFEQENVEQLLSHLSVPYGPPADSMGQSYGTGDDR